MVATCVVGCCLVYKMTLHFYFQHAKKVIKNPLQVKTSIKTHRSLSQDSVKNSLARSGPQCASSSSMKSSFVRYHQLFAWVFFCTLIIIPRKISSSFNRVMEMSCLRAQLFTYLIEDLL